MSSADELDSEILAILRQAPGQVMPWAELRELLPDDRFWPRVESLTRLADRGVVETWKDDQGHNYVSLAVRLPPRRPRPRRVA